jgi:DNA polymerase III subunit delta
MITSLVGENSFLLRRELKKRITAFLAEYDEFGLQKLDGTEASYEQMQEAVQSLPFLAAKKLVVLESPGANKQFLEKYDTLLADVPEITDIIIVESAVDRRTSYYKWLKKSTMFEEYKTPSENELTAWAVKYAKTQGGVLSAGDARYLVQRIASSQEGLVHEIEKLALYDENITKTNIDLLTEPTPQSKIFDLLDAAFSGNTSRAITLYQEQRAQKVQPQEIIAMIGWQLRQIALAKTAAQHDLVREGKVSPYGADKAKRIANRVPFDTLKTQIHDLTHIDAASKSAPIDLDETLQNYIVNL